MHTAQQKTCQTRPIAVNPLLSESVQRETTQLERPDIIADAEHIFRLNVLVRRILGVSAIRATRWHSLPDLRARKQHHNVRTRRLQHSESVPLRRRHQALVSAR